ncbi:hypothetical protein PHLCEN_2v5263 [Hermanssonia centrifuga]|uniref:Uncharacterized protein n=1 Tax=Hermanssonia centrifuga TaxID=98765 RepID=A0A2R6P931_9APHY|nr:hypothetical protein PHLCEN_2v5263 [Hermanssonia centrifuga]
MNNRSQYSECLRRLQTAKVQFEMLQRAMDEAQKNLETSQKEVDDLKADLSGKRTAHLLLSVLEKKETLRKRRIDEIGKSIEELRSTLRSYDIRFRQLASQNDVSNKLESELRLLNLISTILKKPADDPEVITSL